jgi:hypothetical protein
MRFILRAGDCSGAERPLHARQFAMALKSSCRVATSQVHSTAGKASSRIVLHVRYLKRPLRLILSIWFRCAASVMPAQTADHQCGAFHSATIWASPSRYVGYRGFQGKSRQNLSLLVRVDLVKKSTACFPASGRASHLGTLRGGLAFNKRANVVRKSRTATGWLSTTCQRPLRGDSIAARKALAASSR